MTDDKASDFSQEDIDRFKRAIVEQGYAFQHRALAEAMKAFREMGSEWLFEVVEFPVESEPETRVDFVLSNSVGPFSLAVECKRVNPAFSRWLFARAPIRRRNPVRDRFFFDGIQGIRLTRSSRHPVKAFTQKVSAQQRPYQIGFVVRTARKGDSGDGAHGVLERTLRQAVRGANGLINYYVDNPKELDNIEPQLAYRVVIPVVFTTAELVVTEINLAEHVELKTGGISAEAIQPQTVDWLYYEYHEEPKLRHKLHGHLTAKTLSGALDEKFTRTIPVVNAGAIAKFLKSFQYELLTE